MVALNPLAVTLLWFSAVWLLMIVEMRTRHLIREKLSEQREWVRKELRRERRNVRSHQNALTLEEGAVRRRVPIQAGSGLPSRP